MTKVQSNQPPGIPLVDMQPISKYEEVLPLFITILNTIGAFTYKIQKGESITEKISSLFPNANRLVSTIASSKDGYLNGIDWTNGRSLQNVDVAVMEAQFGVAENGAIWITEDSIEIRVLPFIIEHLVVIIDARDIVSNMHEAYERTAHSNYDFGVFIAGPSKTADIEQSLVLGAQGSKAMTILIKE